MKYIDENELANLAKEVREERGLTQEKAAAILAVKQPTLAHAENNPGRSLTKLRIRMIQKFSNLKIEGPFYKVVMDHPGHNQ